MRINIAKKEIYLKIFNESIQYSIKTFYCSHNLRKIYLKVTKALTKNESPQ